MNLDSFVEDRNRAFLEVLESGNLTALKKYCKKYNIVMPKNERVALAGVYKAIPHCLGIPADKKELAKKKCIELGFNPELR